MRNVSWLAAAGLVMITAGCVENSGYPTTYGYSPGYGSGYSSPGYGYSGYSNKYYSQPSSSQPTCHTSAPYSTPDTSSPATTRPGMSPSRYHRAILGTDQKLPRR